MNHEITYTKKFIRNSESVKVNDIVQFTRKGYQYKGEVKAIREMTVIVSVNPLSVPKELTFENNLTVVNHGNYQIIGKAQVVSS